MKDRTKFWRHGAQVERSFTETLYQPRRKKALAARRARVPRRTDGPRRKRGDRAYLFQTGNPRRRLKTRLRDAKTP